MRHFNPASSLARQRTSSVSTTPKNPLRSVGPSIMLLSSKATQRNSKPLGTLETPLSVASRTACSSSGDCDTSHLSITRTLIGLSSLRCFPRASVSTRFYLECPVAKSIRRLYVILRPSPMRGPPRSFSFTGKEPKPFCIESRWRGSM